MEWMSTVNGQRSTVNSQRSMVNGQRDEERESKRSTVNSQRDKERGVNGQWSIVKGTKTRSEGESTVNGQ